MDSQNRPAPTRAEHAAVYRAQLLDWYTPFFAPGQVFELRALKVKESDSGRTHTESGYFTAESLAATIPVVERLFHTAGGLYFTFNPLNPALLARRTDRVAWAGANDSAKDADVIARRWMLVDIDPVRPSGIGSTDAEKAQARALVEVVRDFLRRRGAPDPILADSGNGYHLFYRVDLPADDGGCIQRMLRALAKNFDTAGAKVDVGVHNAGRICKLPGTFARKGDATSDRPHRRGAVLERPTEAMIFPGELFELLAAPPKAAITPKQAISAKRGAGDRTGASAVGRLDVPRWLADRGIAFRTKDGVDAKGRTTYVLANCPFDASHADPDAGVMQDGEGALSAKCFHNSCAERGWREFKSAIGTPDSRHFDKPLAAPTHSAEPATAPPAPSAKAAKPARKFVTINPAKVPVEASLAMITDRLVESGECYLRSDQLVRIRSGEIDAVLGANELAGLISYYSEVRIVSQDGSEYRPLPSNYSSTWLANPGESERLPPIRLFTLNPVYTADWRISPAGYDPATGIYYAGPAVEPRPQPARITALLADFCFRTPADRTNYVALLLTAVLMPRFIGSHPAALFAANQPELGKSILAQIISILRDGRGTGTVTYNPNDEEFEKRLGAAVRSGATTIIVDNAKGRGRHPCIESACLERSITDAVLSFRLLGQSGTIRAENSHIFCITANSPEVSRDLVTRSVLVALYHEGDPKHRAFAIEDPEQYALDHRGEILGELLGMVEAWRAAGSPRSDAKSRFNKKGWGPIVGGILRVAGFADFLGNAEAAALELDDTKRQFGELVAAMADRPEAFWTPADLAGLAVRCGLFPDQLTGQSPRSQSTQLGILASRYVGERFALGDGCNAAFSRTQGDKGNVYYLDQLTPPQSAVRTQ